MVWNKVIVISSLVIWKKKYFYQFLVSNKILTALAQNIDLYIYLLMYISHSWIQLNWIWTKDWINKWWIIVKLSPQNEWGFNAQFNEKIFENIDNHSKANNDLLSQFCQSRNCFLVSIVIYQKINKNEFSVDSLFNSTFHLPNIIRMTFSWNYWTIALKLCF